MGIIVKILKILLKIVVILAIVGAVIYLLLKIDFLRINFENPNFPEFLRFLEKI